MQERKDKIGFGDLSIGLRIPIIMAWIFGTFFTVMFLVGIIMALVDPLSYVY